MARVRGSSTAPPPSATTASEPRTSSLIARCSSSRKCCSPSTANTSTIARPSCCSMYTSLSTKGIPRRSARMCPTVVLPAPMKPTSTIIATTAVWPSPLNTYRGRRYGTGRRKLSGSTGKAELMVKAARLHHHGDPLVVDEVSLPAPEAGEVRVELAFAGVNPVGSYAAAGRVAADGPLPRTVGSEASGHLDGRPVLVSGAGLGSTRDGVWAGAVNVPPSAVVPLPAGVGLPEAAALGVAGLTAWDTLA